MATFPRAGRLSRGYHLGQVDRFLAQARSAVEGTEMRGGERVAPALSSQDVRSAAFDLVRHGYVVDAVDRVLDRLEDALARRARDVLVAQRGRPAYVDDLAARAAELQGRLRRPDRQRFEPAGLGRRGYAVEDVDDLCGRLVGYFEEGQEMSVDEVRRAVFRPRRWRRGYREAPVDVYLDRTVEVMSAVD